MSNMKTPNAQYDGRGRRCGQPLPKTNAERQAAFRASKAESPEVRGVFAHPDDHVQIKMYAARLAKKRKNQLTPVSR